MAMKIAATRPLSKKIPRHVCYQTRILLGIETRHELDGFLKHHEVWDHAYNVRDSENDAAGFEHQL
jgi:hypothetical protein